MQPTSPPPSIVHRLLSSLSAPRVSRFALAAIGLLYLAGLVAMPPEGLTHHDTGAKYLQVRNLRLTPTGLDYSINYPARSLDPDLEFVPFREKQFFIDRTDPDHGLIYLQWPIFLGLLTRIPWKILGFWGLYVVPLLAGIGACWATYRLALSLNIDRRIAWLVIPLVGLATPLSIYSLLFFEHTLAAMLVALSLIFAAKAVAGQPTTHNPQPTTPRRPSSIVHRLSSPMPISGALLAIAVYFRSELYVLVAVMGLVYGLLALRWHEWRWKLAAWALAFLVALLPLWAFYAITEGTLLPLHATWYFAGSSSVGEAAPGSGGFELPALRYIVTAGWGIIPDFLFGPQSFPSSPAYPLWLGALGVGGMLLCVIGAVGRSLARRWTNIGTGWQAWVFAAGLAGVGIASITIALLPEPYHNLHGFVLASPFVALALWPPDRILSREGITPHGLVYVITLAHIVLHALIISSLSGLGPISRHEWGQRYLMSAYPALAVLALLNLTRFRSADFGLRIDGRLVRGALAGLVALLVGVGLIFTARGYVVLYSEKTQVKSWQDLAGKLPPGEPIVTDRWWIPLNLSPVFYSRPIMLAAGDGRLSEWVAKMESRGLDRFAFMSDKSSVFKGSWRFGASSLQPLGEPVEVRGMWMQEYTLGKP